MYNVTKQWKDTYTSTLLPTLSKTLDWIFNFTSYTNSLYCISYSLLETKGLNIDFEIANSILCFQHLQHVSHKSYCTMTSHVLTMINGNRYPRIFTPIKFLFSTLVNPATCLFQQLYPLPLRGCQIKQFEVYMKFLKTIEYKPKINLSCLGFFRSSFRSSKPTPCSAIIIPQQCLPSSWLCAFSP